MNSALDQVLLLLTTVGSVLLAFLGSVARLAHESAHDKPITWQRVALQLPAAIILGVAGHTLGEYVHAQYGLPALTGGALAGLLGYLGPVALDTLGKLILSRLEKESKDGD
jgi:hypothetical protein